MQFISRTHVGKVRRENQDFFGFAEGASIAVVGDGIGGRDFGGIASKMAVDSCLDYLNDLAVKEIKKDQLHHLVNAIKYANDEIITVQRNEAKYANMGSTLVCFGIENDQLNYAWVGDSRVYKLSPQQNQITLLSKDHTLDKDKIDQSLAPNLYKRASSILTQTVGSILLLKPDRGSCDIEKGDIVLACTDGLSDLVQDELMLEYSQQHSSLEDLADKLLDRALDCGGRDNITFVLGSYD